MNAAYAARSFLGLALKLGAQAMKAIIVAAGRGRRLGTETDEIPKCMVKVGGRPILHWQLDALARRGRRRRRHRARLPRRPHRRPGRRGPQLRFVDNPEWATTTS